MYRFVILLILATLCTGCGPRYVDFFPCHDDGTPKPTVALMPMNDHSNCNLPWQLSEEFTSGLRYVLMNEGNLYLPQQEQVCRIVGRQLDEDYFGKDLSFAKKFRPQQFVVTWEMLEHRVVPYSKDIAPIYPLCAQQCNAVLMMTLRLRIIDIRCETPRVVLQEIIKSNHKLPIGRENLDYGKMCWGTVSFESTPFYIAHQHLINRVMRRIEEVVLSVR